VVLAALADWHSNPANNPSVCATINTNPAAGITMIRRKKSKWVWIVRLNSSKIPSKGFNSEDNLIQVIVKLIFLNQFIKRNKQASSINRSTFRGLRMNNNLFYSCNA
jgi:hypothetical protein